MCMALAPTNKTYPFDKSYQTDTQLNYLLYTSATLKKYGQPHLPKLDVENISLILLTLLSVNL